MLKEFLKSKPLFYDKIDYTRMPRVYEKIKEHFIPTKIVHIVGTNAKGTTGRFLATALYKNGYKVGHYTSPHILKLNERIWLNGLDVDTKTLDFYHDILQQILTQKDSNELSYFEYITLLAMIIFNKCDYIILEAGLGGEHDATAVFDKSLTLITPIDFDHQSILGNSIKEIATTKLNAIQNNAIIGLQKHNEVYEIANKLAKLKSLKIEKIQDVKYNLFEYKYLNENLSLAIKALEFFDLDYKLSDFKDAKLFGRLTKVAKNIIIDVGHNTLAANAIVDTLSNNKYVLVYNSAADKSYKEILRILRPIIEYVEIIPIDNQRAETVEKIENVLDILDIKYSTFTKVFDDKKYLVFGSFLVVEKFLKRFDGRSFYDNN
jgi:dihydrofolate synthase/folylpolyglutamate synthase